jgi:hypothetical protein
VQQNYSFDARKTVKEIVLWRERRSLHGYENGKNSVDKTRIKLID